jgi:hypothetical protein
MPADYIVKACRANQKNGAACGREKGRLLPTHQEQNLLQRLLCDLTVIVIR